MSCAINYFTNSIFNESLYRNYVGVADERVFYRSSAKET